MNFIQIRNFTSTSIRPVILFCKFSSLYRSNNSIFLRYHFDYLYGNRSHATYLYFGICCLGDTNINWIVILTFTVVTIITHIICNKSQYLMKDAYSNVSSCCYEPRMYKLPITRLFSYIWWPTRKHPDLPETLPDVTLWRHDTNKQKTCLIWKKAMQYCVRLVLREKQCIIIIIIIIITQIVLCSTFWIKKLLKNVSETGSTSTFRLK